MTEEEDRVFRIYHSSIQRIVHQMTSEAFFKWDDKLKSLTANLPYPSFFMAYIRGMVFTASHSEYYNPNKVFLALQQEIKTCLEKTLVSSERRIGTSSQCVFYPVGQGLMCGIFQTRSYHSVNINLVEDVYYVTAQPATVLYIYDCGSGTQKTFSSGKEYVFKLLWRDCEKYHVPKDGGNYCIDTVFISHFDCDHFNGMERLSQYFKINNLVYPYCGPLEQLEEVFRCVDSTEALQNQDFVAMLLQPDLFMQKQVGAQNMIEIHSESKDTDGLQPLHTISSVGGAVGRLLAEEGEVKVVLKNGEKTNFYKAYMPASGKENGRSERSVWHNIETWRETLTFFVPDGYSYEELEKKFLECLQKEIPEFEWSSENCSQFMLQALGNAVYYNRISAIFKKFGGDSNVKSLCLGIGSIGVPHSYVPGDISESQEMVSDKIIKETHVPLRFPSVLLTGDTELQTEIVSGKSNAQVILEEMRQSGFCNIGSALVPHHGSCHNMDAAAFRILRCIGVWVVSYGRDSRFGHPNKMPCELFGIHHNVLSNTDPKENTFCFAEDRVIYTIFDSRDPERIRLINANHMYHCNDDNIVVLNLTHV